MFYLYIGDKIKSLEVCVIIMKLIYNNKIESKKLVLWGEIRHEINLKSSSS